MQALKLVGVRLTFSAPAGTQVRFTVRAHGRTVAPWSTTTKTSTTSLTIGRRMGGRKLRPGRYTLTLATSGGTRSASHPRALNGRDDSPEDLVLRSLRPSLERCVFVAARADLADRAVVDALI